MYFRERFATLPLDTESNKQRQKPVFSGLDLSLAEDKF
ncbi:hypothetical protein T4B_5105 [Trichinella pseudospiralis]|uniref:Uncharacterized protein n=1 Tax=Trichinella pseudospiralis TaxID=6337 RepID=A0A0V1GJU6_TRIPS|nr:hypothetical protein T4B_8904 [Trichinella pseudospiralis]KRY98535.1 hypothetical protein T4B_5105 [Trichinella pseudospiralis]